MTDVDVVIVERRPDQHVDGSRAGGLLARSLEVLAQRDVVDRFLGAGHTQPAHGFAGIPMDVSDLPAGHNYVLALRQSDFEPILADRVVGDLGVPIMRGREVVGFVRTTRVSTSHSPTARTCGRGMWPAATEAGV